MMMKICGTRASSKHEQGGCAISYAPLASYPSYCRRHLLYEMYHKYILHASYSNLFLPPLSFMYCNIYNICIFHIIIIPMSIPALIVPQDCHSLSMLIHSLTLAHHTCDRPLQNCNGWLSKYLCTIGGSIDKRQHEPAFQ